MPIYVYNELQALVIGLRVANYSDRQIRRASRKANLERFQDSYGVHPLVYCEIWKDLQTTNIAAARIDTTKPSCTLVTFFEAIRFLKKYDTELDRSSQTNHCERFCRDWGWYFLDRVAVLRGIKVRTIGDCDCLFLIVCFVCSHFSLFVRLFGPTTGAQFLPAPLMVCTATFTK